MGAEENIYQKDMELICAAQSIIWENLQNKSILVTGATGLIGHMLVKGLLFASRRKNLNLSVIALVRNKEQASKRFKSFLLPDDKLQLVVGDIETLSCVKEPIDYIVHGASITSSKAFVQQPVETLTTAILGTGNVLKIAREKQVSGFIYLSSMEVYGYPEKGHKIIEEEIGAFPPQTIRNSYPIGKLACESLCLSYCIEYSLPVKIARLTQTFGPGVGRTDKRVFAEFGRCLIDGEDIQLRTVGDTERCYLYSADAVTAILTILTKGENGQVYNVAGEGTYCSIRDMAQLVANIGKIKVNIKQEKETSEYAHTQYIDLDTSKIQALGWHGDTTLKSMYKRMVEGWQCDTT